MNTFLEYALPYVLNKDVSKWQNLPEVLQKKNKVLVTNKESPTTDFWKVDQSFNAWASKGPSKFHGLDKLNVTKSNFAPSW